MSRRVIAMLAIGLAARGALAGTPKTDVEKVVRRQLDCPSNCYEHFMQLSEAIAILPTGEVIDSVKDPPVRELWGDAAIKTRMKVGKMTIGLDGDHGIAWFQAPLDFVGPGGQGHMRVSGVVVDDHGWKLAAVAFSTLADDRDLIAAAVKTRLPLPKDPPKLAGENYTANAVVAWFSSGFAGHASSAPEVIASGSSASEYKTGADASKLVKGWDTLGLVPTSVEVYPFNTYAKFVRVKLMMPIEKHTLGAPLVLTIIALSDGTYAEWVSLQYSAAL